MQIVKFHHLAGKTLDLNGSRSLVSEGLGGNSQVDVAEVRA